MWCWGPTHCVSGSWGTPQNRALRHCYCTSVTYKDIFKNIFCDSIVKLINGPLLSPFSGLYFPSWIPVECIWLLKLLCRNDWTHLEVRVQEVVDCSHVRGFHAVRIHFGLNPLDHSPPQPVTVRQETHDCTRATDSEHSRRFLSDNAQRRSALMNKTEGTYWGSHPSWWIFLQIKRAKEKKNQS